MNRLDVFLAIGGDLSWINGAAPVRETATGFPVAMAIGAAAAALIVAAVVVWGIRRDRARHGPVVRHLAAGLGVGFADRRLLTRVARHAGFSGPGCVLVSRGCFEEAVRRWRGGEGGRLDRIRTVVFGTA